MISVSLRIPAHYVYPQAFVQPSVVIPHVQPSAASAAASPYLDYTGAAYAQYSAAAATTAAAAAAAAYDQYPYAASPAAAGYVAAAAGYGYVQQPLASPAPGAAAAAFAQYQPQQLQTDRMQWDRWSVYDCVTFYCFTNWYTFFILLLLLFYL